MRKAARDEIPPDQAIRLRHAREARGFADAKAAAKFFAWKYNSYAQHENGLRGLRRKVAEKYATAYGVTVGWLLTGEGDRTPAKLRPRGQAQQQPTRRQDDREWVDRRIGSLTPGELARARTLLGAAFPDKSDV